MDEATPWTRISALRNEISKAVVGQDNAISGLVIGLLTGGHILIEGVPGVAKTLLVRALSRTLDLTNNRVQFTPDLMPSDVTGSLIFDSSKSEFSFRPGPVFTNILLADEINRTPPKTQSALLEAMEESQVTIDGTSHRLPDPFMVIATQNPVEYEGTYPLPEAQLDRFLLKIHMELPPREAEIEVLNRHSSGFDPRNLDSVGIQAVANSHDIHVAREEIKALQVSPEITSYIIDIVRATRSSPAVALGVSPRGATALLASARAWAWLSNRSFVIPEDVKAMTLPTFRHRLKIRSESELEGITPRSVLETILTSTPSPR